MKEQIIELTSRLEEQKALEIKNNFDDFLEGLQEIKEKASKIKVTDINQTEEIKEAKKLRLSVTKKRTEIEKKRKELKADSLAYGKAVDSVAKLITGFISPVEQELRQTEEFVARHKAKLKYERQQMLAEYGYNSAFLKLDEMSDEEFAKTLDEARILDEQRQEEKRRILEEEQKKAEEQKKLEEENARLRKQAKEQAEKLRVLEEEQKIKVEPVEKINKVPKPELQKEKTVDDFLEEIEIVAADEQTELQKDIISKIEDIINTLHDNETLESLAITNILEDSIDNIKNIK